MWDNERILGCLASLADFAGADDIINFVSKERSLGSRSSKAYSAIITSCINIYTRKYTTAD